MSLSVVSDVPAGPYPDQHNKCSNAAVQDTLGKLQSLSFASAPEAVQFGYDIVVNIKRATHLPNMDGLLGSADPYVVVIAVPFGHPSQQIKYKTHTIYNNRNPVFDDFIELGNLPACSTITFDVWDKDKGSADDMIGRAYWNFIPTELAEVASADGSMVGGSTAWGKVTVPLKLEHPTKKRANLRDRGTLELEVCYRPSTKAGKPGLLGPVRFKQYLSPAAGALMGQWRNADTMSFSTYKLMLPEAHVQTVFGDKRMPWNRAYDKAVTIFNNPVVLGTVKRQHSSLYSSGIRSSRCGVLGNAHDFFELFKYGQRGGERRYFTYVLLADGSLRCSETGASFLSDIMSKHAMHAAGAAEVLYAGEFCIAEDLSAAAGHCLVIDNNSGTYAPDREALPLLQQLFKQTWPDLAAEVVALGDPKLDWYHKQCPSRCRQPRVA